MGFLDQLAKTKDGALQGVGLKQKSPPVPNDPLGDKRRECQSYDNLLEAMKDDVKQVSLMLQNIATVDAKSTQLAKTLLEANHASWPEFDTAAKQYSDGYSAVYRHYESTTRSQIEKLLFDIETKLTGTKAAIKKVEHRDYLHTKVVEAQQDHDKAKSAGKKTEKLAQTLHKATEEFNAETAELTGLLERAVDERKKFLADSLSSFIEMQSKLFALANSEMSKCEIAPLQS